MGPMTSVRSDQALGRAAEHAAWAFYAVAALGSSIGQIWVGVEAPPWPDTMPLWLRALLALPFAVVIDLGGIVCSVSSIPASASARTPTDGAACRLAR